MAGPGGDEVARVSVRVVPDSSGFRSELARELSAIENSMKVEIPVEADTTGLRSEVRAAVAAAEGMTAEIDVDADTAGARAETRAFAAATEAMTSEIDVGADTAAALTQASSARTAIDAMKATIKVEIDQDTKGLAAGGRGMSGLDLLTKSFGALTQAGAALPNLLGAIGSATTSIASSALSAGEGLLGMGTGMLGIGKAGGAAAAGVAGVALAIVQVLGQMAAFGAQAALVIGIIGAVTAAVGMVGAAVSGLPALLFGVAAAGGAVALGMDGIKRAAQAAVPGLNNLKAAVSGVFEAKLTPMFRDLGERVLPQLTAGFKGVADGVSNLIRELAGVFTSAEGIRQLNVVLGGTQVFLAALTPGFKNLASAMLEAASTHGVWQILGDIVRVVADRIADLFRKFSEGGESSLMVRSLEQFKQVLDAALGAINALIVGATEFFEGAGPGLREMFKSIEEVIKKIDFAVLGQAFGIFARAVGRFFESIPQSTWDTLVQSVQDLALKFEELSNDPNMQAFFNFLIRIIPTCINVFTDFLGAVRAVVNFVAAVFPVVSSIFQTTFNAAKVVVLVAALAIIDALGLIMSGINVIVQNLPGVPQSFRDASQGAVDALGGMRTGVQSELDQTMAEMRGAAAPAKAAGTEIGRGAADGATEGINPMDQQLAREAKASVDSVRGEAGPATAAGTQVGDGAFTGAREGIAPMPGNMRDTTQEAQRGVGAQAPGFGVVGNAIVQALATAIAGGASSVISAAISIARQALNAAKRALGIASPSKVFRDQVGYQMVAGLVIGIEQGAPMAVKAVTAMSGRVATAARDQFAHLPDIVRLGSVSEKLWDELLAAGWKGRAGDRMEALYRPLQDAAVKAGKTAGEQFVDGLEKALAPYKVMPPAISSQWQAFDDMNNRARTSYDAGVWQHWSGGSGQPAAQQQDGNMAALLAALERGLKLDTEQGEVIAKLNNMGQRTLARR